MPTSARDLIGDPSDTTTIVAEIVMKTVKRELLFDDPFSLMKATPFSAIGPSTGRDDLHALGKQWPLQSESFINRRP